MSKILPEDYHPLLGIYDTQLAIERTKSIFEDNLKQRLKLHRVSAPLLVDAATGINDELDGTNIPVSFDISCGSGKAEVVQSLAKWKRSALYRYGFPVGSGIYTDMNAIRRNEHPDATHSIYVDQWDWERVITTEQRTKEFLHNVVLALTNAICDTAITLKNVYLELNSLPELTREVTFITSQELEDRYPQLTPEQRETAITKEYGTVFIEHIGPKLKSGIPQRRRAADYDDWSLNGALIFWDSVRKDALGVASVGIRVDAEALERQLKIAGCEELRTRAYHRDVLNGILPPTIGGGIGQSRLCMLVLGKAHIGEVQAGIWDEETVNAFENAGIPLL